MTTWTTFLHLSGTHPTPILYQHLTDIVFRAVVTDTYRIVKDANNSDSDSATLTFIGFALCSKICLSTPVQNYSTNGPIHLKMI